MTNLEHANSDETSAASDVEVPEIDRRSESDGSQVSTEIMVIPNEIVLHALAANPPSALQNIQAAHRLRAK